MRVALCWTSNENCTGFLDVHSLMAPCCAQVAWYATVGGPGAQSPGALAAPPNGSTLYVAGSGGAAAPARRAVLQG